MLNQVVLVGRISQDIIERDDNNTIITLAIPIPRPYKNSEGVYENDLVNIFLNGEIATNTIKYCKKGDIVGVNGRIEMQDNETKIVADKLTNLSSK